VAKVAKLADQVAGGGGKPAIWTPEQKVSRVLMKTAMGIGAYEQEEAECGLEKRVV